MTDKACNDSEIRILLNKKEDKTLLTSNTFKWFKVLHSCYGIKGTHYINKAKTIISLNKKK